LTLINLSSAQNRKTVRDHTIDTFDRFQFARDLAFNLKTICSDRATAVTAESAAAIDSLAVLPLANAGGNPDTEYQSDGITESLINSLSQIPNLRVVPRSSAFRYKGAAIEPKKAGRQLKVRALLTGKVLQRGDALTVQVELVDVKRNSLFSESYTETHPADRRTRPTADEAPTRYVIQGSVDLSSLEAQDHV
jgi:TolB-like protein